MRVKAATVTKRHRNRSNTDASNQKDSRCQAITELGRRLKEARAGIVASGKHLLDWVGVEREVAIRRGGACQDCDTDD